MAKYIPLLPEQEEQRRRNLYDAGCSDGQIARELGVTVPAIYQWRKARGLPINRAHNGYKRIRPYVISNYIHKFIALCAKTNEPPTAEGLEKYTKQYVREYGKGGA